MIGLKEVLLIGASQGLLLAAVLVFLRSANALANRVLAIFVGFEALHLFWLFTIYSAIDSPPAAAIRLLLGFRVLGPPALFLYVCIMTNPDFRLRARQLVNLLVLAPILVYWLYLWGHEPWRELPVTALQQLPVTIAISVYVGLIFVGYGLLAIRRLSRHRRRLEEALSTTEAISLWWLHWTIALMVGANLLGLVFDGLRLQQLIETDLRTWVNVVATLLVVYLISFGGLRQPRVFTDSIRNALATLVESEHRQGHADPDEPDGGEGKDRSRFDTERARELWEQLQVTLERDRLFLDPDLDLPGLARTLAVRPQELSQVINTQSGGNFYELINHRRVEEAKTLLASPDSRHRKLFDIALSAGFSSQSTFYSRFKHSTGVTPTAYRNRYRQT